MTEQHVIKFRRVVNNSSTKSNGFFENFELVNVLDSCEQFRDHFFDARSDEVRQQVLTTDRDYTPEEVSGEFEYVPVVGIPQEVYFSPTEYNEYTLCIDYCPFCGAEIVVEVNTVDKRE